MGKSLLGKKEKEKKEKRNQSQRHSSSTSYVPNLVVTELFLILIFWGGVMPKKCALPINIR